MSPTAKAAFAALLLLGVPALAHEYKAGELTIGHPYAFPSPTRNGAGYLSITNAGDTPDRLVAIESEGFTAEIHESAVDAKGVARMQDMDGLEIPPGATVTLGPRGIHIMLMDLPKPLKVGDQVPVTLVFEHAGKLPVEFAVDARGAKTSTPDAAHATH